MALLVQGVSVGQVQFIVQVNTQVLEIVCG